MEGYSAGLNASVSLFSDLSASMPEGSVLEELLNKYGTLIFDNVAEGESSQDTLTAGGVSANSRLRELMSENFSNYDLILPPLKYCTDNATMIGVAAFHYLEHGKFAEFDASSKPSMSIEE